MSHNRPAQHTILTAESSRSLGLSPGERALPLCLKASDVPHPEIASALLVSPSISVATTEPAAFGNGHSEPCNLSTLLGTGSPDGCRGLLLLVKVLVFPL